MRSELKAVASQGAAYVLQVGFLVLIAREFGPELQADYAVIRTTVLLAESFMWFGLTSGAVHAIGSDFKRFHGSLITIAISYLYFLAAVSLLTGSVAENFFSSRGASWYLVLIWTLSSGLFQLLQRIFLGQRRFNLYNALNTINALLLFLYFALDLTPVAQNINGLVSVHLLANAVCLAIALVWHARFLENISFVTSVNLQSLKSLLSVGVKGYCSAMLFLLLYRVDFYIVGFFLGKAVLGRYTVAVLIVEAVQKVSDWLGTILSALVAGGEDRSGSVTRRFLHISICWTFFLGSLILLAEIVPYDYIERWLGPDYEGTNLIVLALIPKAIVYGVMVVLAGNLAGRGYTYFHPLAGLLALPVLVVLNFSLIDRFEIWSAVIASTLAMIVAAIVMYRGVQLTSRLDHDVVKLSKS